MISTVETRQNQCHDSVTVISEGTKITLRRERLGWKSQKRLADRAGISRGTVWKIENNKKVEHDMWLAVIAALEAGEAEQSLTDLGLDTAEGQRLGSPLHMLRPSLDTTRRADLSRHSGEYQSEIPRGADAPESAAETRIRELEALLSAEQAAHAEMRRVAAKLTDIIARRLETLETRIAQASHRKGR